MNYNNLLVSPVIGENLLETLTRAGGYYDCPKDETGKRLGPLVGYAGTYLDDGVEKQYVGEVFYNMSRLEQWVEVFSYYSYQLVSNLAKLRGVDLSRPVFIGAPWGGVSVARSLAGAHDKSIQDFECYEYSNARAIFAEKKTLVQAEAGKRSKSMLVFDRHSPYVGDFTFICEDVVNNMTTTEEMVTLIESRGATVVAILCKINRSGKTHFDHPDGRKIRIVSVMDIPTKQYRQDDPYVADDIAVGNLISKPKDVWDEKILPLIPG